MKRAYIVVITSVALLVCSSLAQAKKVYSPIVQQGEVELETQNEFYRSKNPVKDGKSKNQFELSYGFTKFWHSGIYAVYEKPAGGTLAYSQTKWANIVQLTDQGEYWLDTGLYAEYIWSAPRLAKPDVLELKLLLEKPVAQWKHTLNLVFKRPMQGGVISTALEYAWRTEYELGSGLAPAIEIYGSLGSTDKFQLNNQPYLIGPVLEYKVSKEVEVNFGWLMDSVEGPAYGDFKLNAEVEF